MLKFYIETSIMWFIIIITHSIVFHASFKKAQEKINKEVPSNEKKWGFLKTLLWYMFISFVPVFRLFLIVGKTIMIFETDKVIEKMKENKE
jgi:hypothetical protein